MAVEHAEVSAIDFAVTIQVPGHLLADVGNVIDVAIGKGSFEEFPCIQNSVKIKTILNGF